MKKTFLYSEHSKLNAKMIDFAGWLMPVYYSSIKDEVLTVRNNVGIFDVSHMGNIFIEAEESQNFIEYIITNKISDKINGKVVYSLLCNENAGIIDDILVYKISEKKFLLIVNASNTEKDFNWIFAHSKKFNVNVKNVTDKYVLIAIQGPKSIEVVEKILNIDVKDLSYYSFKEIDSENLISRTGYTGELGYEIFVKNEIGLNIWKKLLENGIKPCGLGARDVLRLEAGMPLYGNELSEDLNPFDAGVEKFVKFDKNFIGKEKLLKLKDSHKFKRIGFVMETQRIARHLSEIYNENYEKIGYVSSGTFSFYLNKSIGMGFIPKEFDSKKIKIKLQDKFYDASIVEIPFIKKF